MRTALGAGGRDPARRRPCAVLPRTDRRLSRQGGRAQRDCPAVWPFLPPLGEGFLRVREFCYAVSLRERQKESKALRLAGCFLCGGNLIVDSSPNT